MPLVGQRKRLLAVVLVCLCAVFSSGTVSAKEADTATMTRYVYPVGKTVGIKLFSAGVLVVGLSEIPSAEGLSSPAKACGLQEGDIITHINDAEVNSIETVREVLQDLQGEEMTLRICREEAQQEVMTQAVCCPTDGAYKLGAWIRDSMAGIGTMTFYDPKTKQFGTLGHGINDIDTAQMMPLDTGAILPATVVDVKRGVMGQAGELHGSFQTDRELGTLFANTKQGVFGHLEEELFCAHSELTPVASASEVHEGKATILCNVAGNCVEEFAVEIVKCYPASEDTRDLMLHVTDPKLLEKTGGIVQGMSGSPILQDGKLVAAVTHVLVNDPTRGYGIFIENMLARAG